MDSKKECQDRQDTWYDAAKDLARAHHEYRMEEIKQEWAVLPFTKEHHARKALELKKIRDENWDEYTKKEKDLLNCECGRPESKCNADSSGLNLLSILEGVVEFEDSISNLKQKLEKSSSASLQMELQRQEDELKKLQNSFKERKPEWLKCECSASPESPEKPLTLALYGTTSGLHRGRLYGW